MVSVAAAAPVPAICESSTAIGASVAVFATAVSPTAVVVPTVVAVAAHVAANAALHPTLTGDP